jgi:plastocyanin
MKYMKTTFTTHRGVAIAMAFLVTLLLPAMLKSQERHDITVQDTEFIPDELTVMAGDTVVWFNIGGYHNVNGTLAEYPDNPEAFGLDPGNGWTYTFVFDQAGNYNYHCDPHKDLGMTGMLTVIDSATISVAFTGMDPHVGQDLWLAVFNKNTHEEIGRVKTLISSSFTVDFPWVLTGAGYTIDFYADFNSNGRYDTPPTDHAWRLEIDDLVGDSTLDFAHNTSFTDIEWQHALTLNLMSMNPHVGQQLSLAVTDQSSGEEIGRVYRTIEADFSVQVPGIMPDSSYNIDFYADFNDNGRYDAPPADHAWRIALDDAAGDTTIDFTHNTTFTDIEWEHQLVISFTGMNPHVGQDLYMVVFDKGSGDEFAVVNRTIETGFEVIIPGIVPGNSYQIDFFADFNENGLYDGPPADHAWRLDADDVAGDTTLHFAHNTNFTDIMWLYYLTIDFSGMNPHVDQELGLRVYDTGSGEEIFRVNQLITESFSIEIPGIQAGHSYNVDFYADFNENGQYDAPPADHAWRLSLEDSHGDTTLNFAHNTDFTDIMWQHQLSIHFMAMNPHVGQDLWLAVYDNDSGEELARIKKTVEADFTVDVPGIETGHSYTIDFYADFNSSGNYDAPPVDHAWRLTLDDAVGDTTLDFTHNTSFTDIEWQHKLVIQFMGMNPHDGQDLHLWVYDQATETEFEMISMVITPEFSLEVWNIEPGASYTIDFYADFNDNDAYDAPPVDHAWRLAVENVVGDTTLVFQHNTDFTDIFPVDPPEGLNAISLNTVQLFPNPANTYINLIIAGIEDGSEAEISVLSLSGQVLFSESAVYTSGQTILDIRNLDPGIYLLRIKTEGVTELKKFVKQ